MPPIVEPFFHQPSATWSYLIHDPDSAHAAILDPVLDFDRASGETFTASVDRLIERCRELKLTLDWILETHAHADHLSAAIRVRDQLGGKTAIGHGIGKVQAYFKHTLNLEATLATDGSQFDHLFTDGESFKIGSLPVSVIATPGHTNDSVSYRIGEVLFVGDTLFMPDGGTARCDFPGGDAGILYDSIQKLLRLPAATCIFVCHDYGPNAREPRCETTVAEQRERNIHLHEGISRQQFITIRQARDAILSMPTLIYPAIQINIRAGQLPPIESNGSRYLKIPIHAKE